MPDRVKCGRLICMMFGVVAIGRLVTASVDDTAITELTTKALNQYSDDLVLVVDRNSFPSHKLRCNARIWERITASGALLS